MGMDSVVHESHETLLHLLVVRAGPTGTSIKQLATWTGLPPSVVHRHLQELVVQAKAVREGRGPNVRYRARPYFAALWMDPERGVMDSWETNQPVDWRFPLVTRVPDDAAQEVLVPLLAILTRDDPPGLFSVVVYGSCAEGNARDKSDLDLLVFRNDSGWDAHVREIVDEANLWARRAIDLRLANGTQDIPEGIVRNLRQHGKTVFTNREDDLAFVEYQTVGPDDG